MFATCAPGLHPEPTLSRPFAATVVAALVGLHLPPMPAAARPVVEPVAAPTPPVDLPAWLRDPGHTERAVAVAQAVQLVAVDRPEPRAVRASRPPLPQPVEAYGAPNARAASAVAYARAQVGKRYVLGEAGPSAFDCSGLTMKAWAQAGVRLPHKAAAQRGYGRAVSRAELQPGDLVFWGSYHVAIYVGNGEVVAATKPATGVKRQRIWGSPSAYRRMVG